MSARLRTLVRLLLVLPLLAACATGGAENGVRRATTATGPAAATAAASPRDPAAAAVGYEDGVKAEGRRGFLDPGTGAFIGRPRPEGVGWRAEEEGEVTLDFEGADLKEVVKVVLGDILGVNYLVDERVRGQATLHTNRPVAREALLSILEATLQASGAALLAGPEGYQVVPMANAMRSGLSPAAGAAIAAGVGYRLQVVPLRFVSAGELAKVLEPFIPEGTSVRPDEARNLLILAGPARLLGDLVQTIDIFDADWLRGMSFGLFPLEQAEAKGLTAELEQVLGLQGDGPLRGMLRVLPIERLNAVLVISKRPEYLERIGGLVRRFDQGGGEGRRLHVHHLSHGKAADLATVLNDLYGQDGAVGVARVTAVAPAAVPTATATETEADAGGGTPVRHPAVAAPIAPATPVAILADVPNNALLVLATAAEYAVIESAIRKLDIPRRQVLVEATIAEVTLTDNLQYGLQWFLRGGLGDYRGEARLISSGLARSVAPGFSYSLTDAAGVVRLLFDALASESKLKILSSPQVLVMDNESANIRVGDQIPIVTRTTTSITDPAAPIVNEIQFRDTGVLLQVTPHINAGGMVALEISQEVSEPSADEFAAGNVSILQRTIQSSVAVQSGETVVLGGLIRENKTNTVAGVPVLARLPLLGKLFSRTVENVTRTELVVTITPRVITTPGQAREASRELIRRMRGLEVLETDLLPARESGAAEPAGEPAAEAGAVQRR